MVLYIVFRHCSNGLTDGLVLFSCKYLGLLARVVRGS
jgi:hypothetical protein